MVLKWPGKLLEKRKLNSGGAQGGTAGLLEFLSKSDKNANCVENYFRLKWVDNLTFLEIINRVIIKIAS